MIAYHRRAENPDDYAMVVINFASYTDTIEVPFPKAGTWTEKIDDDVRTTPWIINVAADNAIQSVTVPSNYGFVFALS
jgi:Alpha amylase, C-terminal all-beta domain